MSELTYLSDENLREIISRDIIEMRECLEHKLPKATMLLAGSIIEAILVDYFLAFPPPNGKTRDQIMKATLENLISWASDQEVKLISEDTRGITTVIRNYRNLIHPGVEHRKEIKIDMAKAAVAANLVEIIIDEIGTKYTEKLGVTADQVIGKLKKDDYSPVIIEHLIKNMAPSEKIKLYKRIPSLSYFETPFDSFEEKLNKNRFFNFFYLYHDLVDSIPNNIREKEAINQYSCITQKSKEDSILSICFLGYDIGLLDVKKRNLIMDYLLNVIGEAKEDNLHLLGETAILYAIGKYYENSEHIRQLMDIVSRVYTKKLEKGLSLTDNTYLSHSTVLLDVVGQIISCFNESNFKEFIENLSLYSKGKLIPVCNYLRGYQRVRF